MKTIKALIAASALVTVAGAANATVWNIEMNTDVYFPAAAGPLQMIGFIGTWDDVSNTGSWTGTTVIPGFNTTLHYTQTFTMNELTGVGTLNQFDLPSCTDNTGSACLGLASPLSGTLKNTFANPANPNDYKKQLPFTPTDGWAGQWTLQVNRLVIDSNGNTSLQFMPIPMNVCVRGFSECIVTPIPTTALLFGSGLMGLVGATRRRRSA